MAVKLPTLPNDKKLTVKQAEFYKEWLSNGGNGVKAALKVYDTDDYGSANTIATENLQKLVNPTKFYMENKGIGIGRISDVIDEAMKATKWNDFTGEREADHHIRLKAVERVTKMSGMETEHPAQQTNVQINFSEQKQKEESAYAL